MLRTMITKEWIASVVRGLSKGDLDDAPPAGRPRGRIVREVWFPTGVEGTMVVHTDVWKMLAEVRAHCVATRVPVTAKNHPDERTTGFETNCPVSDVNYRDWRIKLADVSRTANKMSVSIPGIFLNVSDLMGSEGRRRIASILSS